MMKIEPKKTHKQKWQEWQRKAAKRGFVTYHPYDNSAGSLHPYAVDNPNNPYATPRTDSSEKGEYPKRRQTSSDKLGEKKSE